MARNKRKSKKSGADENDEKRDQAPLDDVPTLDRRAIERHSADVAAAMAEQDFESIEEANAWLEQVMSADSVPQRKPRTPLEQAQDIMYDAFDAEGKQRVKLAKRALETSPDCADAYVLLAEEEARSFEEARDLYETGLAAGERALGPEAFEELKGDFWGVLETRPYMRARSGLAFCLWELGEREAAAKHMQDMLELNPNDNQGVRTPLALWLLELGHDDAADDLLRQYRDDGSIELVWARAILKFQTRGAGAIARRRFREAVVRNPTVILYLTGAESLPDEMPEYISYQSPEEAMHAAVALMPVLGADEELFGWFVRELDLLTSEPEPPE